MAPFEKGMTKIGGRQKGVRNKLSHSFLTDLLEEWTEHGRATLKIARIERPVEFAKLVAGLLPREFELEISSTVTQLSDDELDRFIAYCRDRLATGSDARLINGGTDAPTDGKQTRLLPAVSETS
jgi:hypothetical protein